MSWLQIGNYALMDFMKYMQEDFCLSDADVYVSDDKSITVTLSKYSDFSGASLKFEGDGIIRITSPDGRTGTYDDHGYYRKDKWTGKYLRPSEYIRKILRDCCINDGQHVF